MRTVQFTAKKIDDGDYRGEVKVRGFQAIDYGISSDDVREKLIAHLIEEDEIKEGQYIIENTLVE